jgi:hypothetical protein
MTKRAKTGGRTAGTPNVGSRELRAFAQRLLARPKFRAALGRALDDMTVPAPVLITLMHYAAGQPPKAITVTGNFTLESIVAGTAAAATPATAPAADPA